MSAPPGTPSLRGAEARAKPIPLYFWPLWMGTLGVALVVFYGILTPVWMLVRLVAWVSERRLFAGRAADIHSSG